MQENCVFFTFFIFFIFHMLNLYQRIYIQKMISVVTITITITIISTSGKYEWFKDFLVSYWYKFSQSGRIDVIYNNLTLRINEINYQLYRGGNAEERELSVLFLSTSRVVTVLLYSVFHSQQDAQEFLRYLLQGLHEDVNRVKSKPKYIGADDEKEDKMS